MTTHHTTFPIMRGFSIPWEMIAPHEAQAWHNHSQSLTTLARRGGLDSCEALWVLNDQPIDWQHDAKVCTCREQLFAKMKAYNTR